MSLPANISEGMAPSHHCDWYRFIMSFVIIGTISILGIVGNILSANVLGRHIKDSESTGSVYFFLTSLAACDTLVLFCLIVMKTVPSFCGFVEHFYGFFDYYPHLSMWGWPLMDLAHAWSTWITVLVVWHRYMVLCKPNTTERWCALRAAVGQMGTVVVLCTLFELPVFTDYQLETVTDDNNETQVQRVLSEHGKNHLYQIIYKNILYYLLMYIIPLILLVVFTTLVVRTIRGSPTFTGLGDGHRQYKKEVNEMTKILLAIVIVCILCNPWEPVRRIFEATLLHQPGCGHFYFWYEEFPSLSFAVNSASNFAIYLTFGTRFQEVFQQQYTCLKCCFCWENRVQQQEGDVAMIAMTDNTAENVTLEEPELFENTPNVKEQC